MARASPEGLSRANYAQLIRNALEAAFPDVEGRREQRALRGLISSGAPLCATWWSTIRIIGAVQPVWLLADDEVDQFWKGFVDRDLPESARRIEDQQIQWIDHLASAGRVELKFNEWLFTQGDSREPELAGIAGAVVGSFYMMLVTLALSVPLGIGAAIFLEEFAPKNTRWVDLIEVNVNNLAAVPSIVFGLLGLAVFLNLFGMPRSAPLVGGLTLAIMTLPTIVVVTRRCARCRRRSVRPRTGSAPRRYRSSRIMCCRSRRRASSPA